MNKKTETTSPKNGKIEFLRFLFSICIVLHHGTLSWPLPTVFGKISLFKNGAVSTEFFFLVSVFLLAKKADKRITSHHDERTYAGAETLHVISKKYFYIFPYHIYAYICSFFVTMYANHLTIRQLVRMFIDSLPNLFLLDMTGIPYTIVNGYEWYISAMFIAIFLIYPLLRINFDLTINVIAPLASVMILGWISYSYGTIASVVVWTGLVYKGVLRGLSVMLLGCVAYALYQKINALNFTKRGISLLTFLEWGIYFLTVLFICTNESELYYIYFAILLAIAIAITFSGKTQLFRISERVCWFLGKLSLPLYLNQWYSKMIVEQYMTSLPEPWRIWIYLILAFINAVICMYIVDFLKKKFTSGWFFVAAEDGIK